MFVSKKAYFIKNGGSTDLSGARPLVWGSITERGASIEAPLILCMSYIV